MKKIYCFFVAMLLLTSTMLAQTVTLTFTGKDSSNRYCQLDRVVITNLSKNWQETLYWPDTILEMGNVGIDDYGNAAGFSLSQNVPNPFAGISDFSLCLPKAGPVIIEVYDLAGRKMTAYQNTLTAGCHIFKVLLSTPQSYVLMARSGKDRASIKMVNTGNAGANDLFYVGEGSKKPLEVTFNDSKGQIMYPFSIGDQMEYVGYATVNGVEVESEHIVQAQDASQIFTLQFETPQVSAPTVITFAVTNITDTSATCGGNVTSDNDTIITACGVCWSTFPNPTIADSYTIDGTDTGSFTSTLTDLVAGLTYYVRAYAAISAGVAYGNEVSFSIPLGNNICQVDTAPIPNNQDCGSGCAYYSSITFTAFPETSTIQSPEDILHVRVKLEHSFVGDIYIALSCPNGQRAALVRKYGSSGSPFSCMSQIPLDQQGWSVPTGFSTAAYLGDPIDDEGNDCNPDANPMGTTWNYCWSNNTQYGYEYANGSGYVYEVVNIVNNHIDSTNTVNMTNVYHPDDSFGTLIGCPLNGTWSIIVMDGRNVDNGYVTEWEMVFDPLLIESPIPVVLTGDVSNIDNGAAVCGVNVFGEESSVVSACGVCWSTSPNPTIADSHTIDGTGTGNFVSTLTGLSEGVTYYVRAYANHSMGTAYGLQKQFNYIAASLPTVSTDSVTIITQTSATCSGNVTDDGHANVTARGVCWSTSPNPTIVNSHTLDGLGTGSFTSFLPGLVVGSTYYVRAYATNIVGTAYGVQRQFVIYVLPTVTTMSVTNIMQYSATCCGNVTDDGGTGVTARGFCWSTSPNPTIADDHTTDGTGMGSYTGVLTGLSENTTYYVRAYATNSVGTVYGEQMEFTTIDYVTTMVVADITHQSATCGGSVASDGDTSVTARGVCWSTSPNPTIADSHTTDGTGVGSFVSTLTGLAEGITYYVRAYAVNSTGAFYGNQLSFTTLASPTVTTDNVSNVTWHSVTSGGNVSSDGGANVTARGVCWSTSPNPTISGSHTTDGTGVGNFVSSLTGLSENTTYYVRAYAINDVGIGYGNQQFFTTIANLDGQPCPGTPIVTDVDSNTYNTILIDNQCWMKENLRTTRYANGTFISLGNTFSGNVPYRYYPNNDSSNVTTYGYLYNWKAVVINVSYGSVHSGQGICPTGWHVPTYEEWLQLKNYVSNQSQYVCDNDKDAKAWASSTGWNSSTNACSPGNNPSTNNATGFSAVPAGYYSYCLYVQFGDVTYFWSSSASEEYLMSAYAMSLSIYNSYVDGDACATSLGYSVRCIKD